MSVATYRNLNRMQRMVLLHAHPANFVLHLLGLMWGSFFIWNHRLWYALLCLIGLSFLGYILAWRDRSYLQVTSSSLNLFQKLLLYHYEIPNLILHLLGFGLFFYGTWIHRAWVILMAFSLLLIGHVNPWMKHGREEALEVLAVDEEAGSIE